MRRHAAAIVIWGIWFSALILLHPLNVSSNTDFARRVIPFIAITLALRLAHRALQRNTAIVPTGIQPSRRRSIGLSTFAALLIVVGALQLIFWALESAAALRVKSWPTTIGSVQTSSVRTEVTGNRERLTDMAYRICDDTD
jgi:hypothetical protein